MSNQLNEPISISSVNNLDKKFRAEAILQMEEFFKFYSWMLHLPEFSKEKALLEVQNYLVQFFFKWWPEKISR
jgi:hypothetical protein